MMLGKGAIVGLSAYLTFLLVTQVTPEVQQPLFPAVLIGILAYLVGSMFLSIFSFASTAILHCFLLDEDTGGGNERTPDSLKPFLEMSAKNMASKNNKKGGEENEEQNVSAGKEI